MKNNEGIDDLLKQAQFLYFFNGGAISKRDCVKKVLNTYDTAIIMKNLHIFDITIDDYIDSLCKEL